MRPNLVPGVWRWAGLLCLVGFAAPGRAQPESEFAADRVARGPAALSLPAALAYALENNPAMAAQRRQRGIAAARVVIADTYPFNPTLEARAQHASGPPEAGITNRHPVEGLLLWELEVHGQARHRRDGAVAALSRTEWEIAAQEQALAAQVVRAYAGVQYRQEKLRLLDETLKLNERLVEDVGRLVTAGKLRTAELIVARTEVSDTLDLASAGREALTAARQDLLRALGLVEGAVETDGPFEPPPWAVDPAALGELALARRADLRARQMAVAEAAAGLRLAEANRYGNPVVGPAVGRDPSKVTMVGAQVSLPLPVANTHRGEVLQAEAEHAQAASLLRQAEVSVRQDLASGLARLAAAEQRAEQFRSRVLPDLRRAVEDMEKLFQAGEPGVDVLRVIDVRRKLLRARDGYLDAVWSVRQARADVAAAVGEPALGLAPAPAVPTTDFAQPKP
jgi:cobalt-zinc-cadmium efflux system outer membrane protein